MTKLLNKQLPWIMMPGDPVASGSHCRNCLTQVPWIYPAWFHASWKQPSRGAGSDAPSKRKHSRKQPELRVLMAMSHVLRKFWDRSDGTCSVAKSKYWTKVPALEGKFLASCFAGDFFWNKCAKRLCTWTFFATALPCQCVPNTFSGVLYSGIDYDPWRNVTFKLHV